MFEKELDRLYELVIKENEGKQLTDPEVEEYIAIVDTLKENNIEIPFGIEL